MSSPFNFQLYEQVNNQNYAPDFLMQVDASIFLCWVRAACVTILNYTSTRSAHYVQSQDEVRDGFEPHAKLVLHHSYQTPANRLDYNGGSLYFDMMMQLKLLEKYVEWKNLGHQTVVGDEHNTKEFVYHALVSFHNWKVGCLEDSIKKNGPNWGSATRWNTENVTLPVRGWPFKYGFEARVIHQLPCEREKAKE